jgi:16S rRNA (adenine1518-N6/adenine1519-N6)-dimethyltransferase
VTVIATLERVTQAAFSQRRKMLRSSLRGAFGDRTEEALAQCGVAATARAEEIAVDRFLALADFAAGAFSATV